MLAKFTKSRHKRPSKWRSKNSAFTLVELTIATAISVAIGVSVVTGLVTGTRLLRANETEMWARDKGSRVIRRIYSDMTKASDVHIYSSYTATGGAESTYGSCVVLDLPDTGTSVAYYLTGGPNTNGSGGIYYDASASTAPAPNIDKLCADNILDLEFRRNSNGTVRVGFAVGFIGPQSRQYGSKETDRVRFSMSVTNRN